jgi:type II secretory pathway pseudopilin PulG
MTLLELILALALSAILVTIMAAALRIAIGNSVNSRGDVEQMRVVQGVISRLTEDIKAAAVVETLDTSGAMALAKAAAGFDVDTIDTETLGAAAGGAGTAGGTSTGDPGADPATDMPLREPLGVFGLANELRIDVLREEPQLLLDEQGMVLATAGQGGIFSVRYAVGDGVASLGTPKATLDGRDNVGLIRQELSRDLMSWAQQTGSYSDIAGEPLLMAAEVEQMEFRYFDGYEYFETWDPYNQGPWPRAIEVRMWFVHPGRDGRPARNHEERPYVVTVALPTAWNPPVVGGGMAPAGAADSSASGGAL